MELFGAKLCIFLIIINVKVDKCLIVNTFTIHLGICTLQFCLFNAYSCLRTWEQMRPNQGADATASGSRCVRVWEQMQLRLGPDAVTHGPRRSCAWGQTHLNAGQRSLTDIEDGAVSHIWQKLICRRARQMLTLHQAKRIHEDRKR